MNVINVAIAELNYDPANVRTHSKRNIEAIKNSLKRFGQQKPIVIDKDKTIVAGNGTVQAASELGWIDIKAVSTDIEGPEAIAFAIADNRSADLASWDRDALVKILKSDGVGDVGFSKRETELMIQQVERISGPKAELQITPELYERHDYIVVIFDNELDWNVATEKLGITTVKGKMNGAQKIQKFGIGRVIKAEKLLECLK